MKKSRFLTLLCCLLSVLSCPRPLSAATPWTRNISAPFTPKQGLAGRHICVWASHGRYFDTQASPASSADTLCTGQWRWQRPYLFCTTEDLLTPSFVYPFLIPMLENAGAVVWTPRERDPQTHMTYLPEPTAQTPHHYEYRAQVDTVGSYAVYATYPDLPDAVPDAVYTIHHGGERTRIAVNQRMGANTWVYLGTYLFNPAIPGDGLVRLSKTTLHRGRIAAGALRIGGGMGHISRSALPIATDSVTPDTLAPHGTQSGRVSGLPHYLESSRYWAQWAGLPDSLYNTTASTDDYRDDLRTRANFLNHLLHVGHVPFNLSLAVHSDAGYRTDSIPYGSLAICTTIGDDGTTLFPDSTSRTASRQLTHQLITTLTHDLADLFWQQRGERDANYAETRMPQVPSAIIETLSHQNFLDMRYAHDPIFKFRLARALYKAILRSTPLASPVIQPLPVRSFAANLAKGEALLSWRFTPDTLEPTALPTHYIIYTRLDDGDFDNGQLTTDTLFRQPIAPGHRYTFRVVAANSGGLSFPSEQLTVYQAPRPAHHALLVSAFTRLSGPAYISTPDSLGFLLDQDPGVPYGTTFEYCGPQLDFSPSTAGKEGPGALGYSSNQWEGRPLTGNTFDIVPRRAALLVQADSLTSFSSACADALRPMQNDAPTHDGESSTQTKESTFIYYLAGQQRRAAHNMADFPVWPVVVRPYIEEQLCHGATLHVEGAYVAPSLLSPEEREWWNSISYKYKNIKLSQFPSHVYNNNRE